MCFARMPAETVSACSDLAMLRDQHAQWRLLGGSEAHDDRLESAINWPSSGDMHMRAAAQPPCVRVLSPLRAMPTDNVSGMTTPKRETMSGLAQ